jgi:PAS domain S-box-containing protein
MRSTGIEAIGHVPWGTHFCQFYRTVEDLIDVLAPYFCEGLRQNEFCMWVTSPPLSADDAAAALRRQVPRLDDYLRRGQIEILDYGQWCTSSGRFEADRVLQGWIDKEKHARDQGYEGLRLSANTFWLERAEWKAFSDYEAAVSDVIGHYRMIALCTYCLDKCGAYELIDVVSNHQFALIKQLGEWKIIESRQQREVEDALQDSRRCYETLVEHSPLAIAVHRDAKYLYVNPSFLKLVGASRPEDVLNKELMDFVHPDDRGQIAKRIAQVQTGGKPDTHSDSRLVRLDGETIHVSAFGALINFDGHRAVQVVIQDNSEKRRAEEALRGTCDALGLQVQAKTTDLAKALEAVEKEARRRQEDVAARMHAEKALAESELRHRSLVLATSEVVWTTNAAGEVPADMPYWREFTGQSLDEIKGWGWSNAVHPEDVERVRAAWSESVRSQRLYQIEYRLRRGDGQYRNVSVRGVPVLDKDGRISEWIGTCVDITDQKRMQEELRKASLYSRSLIEASLDPLVTISPIGQIMDVNKATEVVTGVVREKLIGSDFSTYFTDPRKADEGYRRVLSEGSVTDYPLTIRHISGCTTDVRYNAAVYRNEAGEVQGVFAAARDVTEHNRMDKELHALHKALESRADQLRSLASELTLTEHRERHRLAQALHDHLQQLLYAARLGVTTIRRQVGEQGLQKLIQDLDTLLSQCIDESRSVTLELSPPVLYDAGLIQALEWLARQMQLNYGLMVDVQADVRAEPQAEDIKVLLFQSVRELLFNVVKHAGASDARVRINLTPGGQVCIDVIDKGEGFDANCARTDGEHAAGFGLFSIRERLEYLGGRMEVQTAAGEGTSVSILAPCQLQSPPVETRQTAAGDAAENRDSDSSPGPARADGTGGPPRKIRVVLADDHTILRKGLLGVLNQEPDIEVVAEAADGEMAVEMAKNHNPDVVLMDVTMPKLDGIEATRRIASARLGVHVIGYSAHKEEDLAQALYEAGAVGYLSKDQPAESLVAAIRKVPLRLGSCDTYSNGDN